MSLYNKLNVQYNITNPDCLAISGSAVYFNILKEQGLIKGDLPENLECYETGTKEPLDDLDLVSLSQYKIFNNTSLIKSYILVSNSRSQEIKDLLKTQIKSNIRIKDLYDLLNDKCKQIYTDSEENVQLKYKNSVSVPILLNCTQEMKGTKEERIKVARHLIEILKLIPWPFNDFIGIGFTKTTLNKLFEFKEDVDISKEDIRLILNNMSREIDVIKENQEIIEMFFNLHGKITRSEFKQLIDLLISQ